MARGQRVILDSDLAALICPRALQIQAEFGEHFQLVDQDFSRLADLPGGKVK